MADLRKFMPLLSGNAKNLAKKLIELVGLNGAVILDANIPLNLRTIRARVRGSILTILSVIFLRG